MAKLIYSQKRFVGGIADYLKESSIPDSYYFGTAIDYRTDPQSVTLLPMSVKESGSVVTDLLKWGDLLPSTLTSYYYGNTGNIYSRSSAGSWTNLHTTTSSHGNGLAYFFADDYLYYTSDSTIGRYGTVQGGSPQFSDDFLKAQGGVPMNTASVVLVAASSQYMDRVDSASLSITGNLTLEGYFKAASLPAVGNSMTLIGKWDESGALRSYKMDLYGVSGFFGDGSDGALVISTNTTEAPIDSACTGTAGTQSLTATNAGFAAGQVILIHQTQGTGAGTQMRNTIQGYTAGTITLQSPLNATYGTGAQVRVMKQYTNVTVNSGITYTAKAWNGTTGGIIGFLANGTVSGAGNITATGKGFAGGVGVTIGFNTNGVFGGTQGDGTSGVGIVSTSANGSGGGGGLGTAGSNATGGGGGGNATAGGTATAGGNSGGTGGAASGSADLTTITFGGGGGGGGLQNSGNANSGSSGNGGNGGGIIYITAVTHSFTGNITSNGNNGTNASGLVSNATGGAGGAAGSILFKAQTATLGTNLITASAGTAGTDVGGSVTPSGIGSVGRININYLTSYTGTTTPTINAIQDNTLVTTTTIQARLGISNDGTAFEHLTQNLNGLTTATWNRLSIAWTASTSTAQFYLNALYLGSSVGTKTAIHDNTSNFYVGANKNATVVANFFDGKFNDFRVWNNVQTAGQIYANNQLQVSATSAGLQAYYKFNSAYTDATANANILTNHSTTFDTADVPFPASTTRLDIDQSYTVIGQTYTLPTAISEAGADLLSFTPIKDPQKSMAFNVSAKGTGNWTVTIHDQQNNIVATQTITNANMAASGWQEFIYTTSWRITIGKTYHAHLTSTVGDGIVVTSTTVNFSTADFYTYYGFLVTDTQFHPIIPFLNFMAFGNERYVATWDGASYNANNIALPVGWRVRCFGFWREYLAIGVWRGTNIYDYDNGRVYFWDGISSSFNFFIDVPEGQINAMHGRDSDLYMWIGYRGVLMDYQGGYFYNTGNSASSKLKQLPKSKRSDYIEVYPGALNYYRGLLHIGVAANSNSTTIAKGTYAFGSLNKAYPETLSCDYVISTGNSGSTVSIGMVFPAGQSLIVGWQDGNAFGADKINFSNNPATSGSIELLVQDNGFIWKDKQIMTLRGDHLPLKSGESIDIKYKVDRATNYTISPINSTVGSKEEELAIQNGRGNEYQIAVDLYATGTTSPTLLGLSVLGDDGSEEEQF